MKVNLNKSEIKQILVWAEHMIEGGHFGDGNFMIPEEAGIRDKLQHFEGEEIELSAIDLKIIKYWAEGTLGSILRASLPEEISVIDKLKFH